MNSHFHGIFSEPESLRNFVEIAIFKEAKTDGDGLVLRQGIEGFKNEFLSFEEIYVYFLGGLQSAGGLDWLLEFSLFAADFFETSVPGDSSKPADDGLGVVQFLDRLQGFHDRALDQILGGGMVADVTVGDGIEDAIIRFDNLSEPLSYENGGNAFGPALAVEPLLDTLGRSGSSLRRRKGRAHVAMRGSQEIMWMFVRDSKQGDGWRQRH